MSTPFTTTWPQQAKLAQAQAHKEGTIFLWSGGDHDASRQSLLFVDPCDKVVARNWEELETTIQDGIWAGYLGYEMGRVADRDRQLQRLQAPSPDAVFYRYKRVYTAPAGGTPPDTLLAPLEVTTPLETRASYIRQVEQVQEAIRAGELYQMCLSHECWLTGSPDPFGIFCRITQRSPAPFAAYLNCGSFAVVSASPERFLSRNVQLLETRPIKGTMPSSGSPQQLRDSQKERAELMMITDLMRNDLGRVSVPGTVRVDAIREIQEYAGVYQAYSIIRSRLKPGISSLEVLRQAFPPGSISGCPKLRAMELIQQIERRPRGVYTGAIGYLWGATRFDFNVAIRTVVAYPDALNIPLGGAIVADSDPAAEYEETLHKGRPLFDALGV